MVAEHGSPESHLEDFLLVAHTSLRHKSERQRADALLLRWTSAWQSKTRVVNGTFSNHGAYLHFAQFIQGQWVQVFTFHAAPGHGLSLRGPDTDRTRKSHKHRANRLETAALDALFAAWSAHPESRPAGHAVEFFLTETPDDSYDRCLQDVMEHLGP
ncbi:MAG: hypothetical protein IPL96_12380 [Holophagaceae bacterium]|nr:hypothetical protein [Holophagaceae bacterium]